MSKVHSVVLVGALRASLSDHRSGGQTFACTSLAKALAARGWVVHGIDSSIESIRARSGFHRLPAACARLVRFVWACVVHRPDAALVFSSSGLSFVEKGVMVVIARLLGVRGILMPRSGPLRENLESSRIMRLFARMVFLCAYRVVCQSEGWRSYFLSLGSNESKLEVVENWIPGSSFASSSAAVAKSEQETFVVGFFSRVEIEKGIFDYLEAIRRAHIREPHIRGLIYGDGSAMPAVEAWIRENDMGGVILCGGWLSADMKFERLRRLDALLFASHSEGFPNSVLEAVAMKVPIISVRVGAVEDFLVHQESSLLATIGDVEDLASHVLTLATEESFRIRYACAAYERAVRQNTERCAVERIAEVLS